MDVFQAGVIQGPLLLRGMLGGCSWRNPPEHYPFPRPNYPYKGHVVGDFWGV